MRRPEAAPSSVGYEERGGKEGAFERSRVNERRKEKISCEEPSSFSHGGIKRKYQVIAQRDLNKRGRERILAKRHVTATERGK